MKNKLFREFSKYVSLNMLGMLGLSCYILADTLFVAQGIGTNGLAALNLALPIYSLIHGIALMLGIGGSTKYIILKSRGEDKNANAVFTNTVALAAIFAAIFILMGLFLSDFITRLLGANSQVFDMTNIYLKVILLFSPAFMLNEIFICFVRNDGGPGLSMTAMLLGSLFNIIFDYIFIFPLRLGILGAVLATGFSPVISMAIMSIHKIRRKNGFSFTKLKPSIKIALNTFALGFPSLVAELSSGIVMVVFNLITLQLAGNVGVAAYGVVANIALVVIAIYTGLAQGTQPLISRAYGLGNTDSMRRVLRYATGTVLIMSPIIYAVMFFFAKPIAAVFNSENDPQLSQIAVVGLWLYFTAVGFVGFNIVMSSYFTSVERPIPAHIISLLRGLVIIIPAILILSALWGINGVWLSYPLTEGIVAIFGAVAYLRSIGKGRKRGSAIAEKP